MIETDITPIPVIVAAAPLVHRIEHTYDLQPGNYLALQLDSPEDVYFLNVAETWLMESKVIRAWYALVRVELI